VTVKLFKRLSRINLKVRAVRDYDEALLAALRLIGAEPPKVSTGALEGRLQEKQVFDHYEHGRHILRCDRWNLLLDDYSLTVEVIDRRIYHALSSGILRDHHLASVARLREEVRRTIGLEQGFAAIVTGTGDAHATDRIARRHYMADLKQWHQQYPMGLYVFYNANRFIRTAAMLAIPFMPFRVKVAGDLAGALTLVDRFAGIPTSASKQASASVETVAEDPLHVVHQLLQFIGDIDWERCGLPTPNPVDPTHPFRPVFDGIALIKGELDSLFDERHQAEKALRESQQRFDEVLKHSRDILFKRNLDDGTYDYVSDAMTHLLGFTPEETRRMGFGGVQALIHPEDLARFLTFNQGLRENTGTATADHVIEYRLRDRQGRYRWFSDSHSIVSGGPDKPAFVIGSNRDITDQKAAEEELTASHQCFTTLLDSISAHIYVGDLKSYEILFINRAMRDVYGDYRPGDRCFDVFFDLDAPCAHCSNKQLLDEKGQPTGLHIWEGFDRKRNRWYLNHDQAIPWVDGRLVRLRIAVDISRIKALEAERQEVAERLRYTRKLEAVNTMAGGVAHHFNNLLMVVLGNLELMRMNTPADSSLGHKIDAAEKSARRAADLSSLMLTYVGQTRISPQTVNLAATLAEMVGVLQTTVAEKAVLTLASAGADVWIHADVSKVCQVITNLVTNAVEASGDAPLEIQLGVGSQHCDAAQLSRLAPGEHLPEGRYAWLRVSDNGRGMD
ncbi:MAG: PAS domain S-box protein, partial [Desulfosarcina sp.]